MLHDTGAFMPWGLIMPYIAAVTVPGPYVVPNYRLEMTVAVTNKVPTTPVRGAGRPQAVFAMERLMDRVARELKLDRAEVRRRNMIQPEQMPYAVGLIFRDGKPLVYHGGDFPHAQATAIKASGYDGFARTPGRGAQARPLHRHRHRQLRRRHRPRPVRRRHRARAAERQGRGRDRRDQPGPGPAHDADADRRRPASAAGWKTWS